jgi:hypothetical protein
MPVKASLGCLFALVASTLLAQATPPVSSAPSLTGRWLLTFDIHGTRAFGSMDIEQHNEKIQGTYDGQKLEGSFKGGSLHLVAEGESGGETFDATQGRGPLGFGGRLRQRQQGTSGPIHVYGNTGPRAAPSRAQAR